MTACPIRYQRQVSDRNGKIFYTSFTSLSHLSKQSTHIAIRLLQRILCNDFRSFHENDKKGVSLWEPFFKKIQ